MFLFRRNIVKKKKFWYDSFMTANRMDKVDELIKNEVSLLLREFFPEEIISVTQVKASKDFSYAKIWVSSVKNIDDTVKKCQTKSSEIRKELAEKIELRRIPSLHFVPDKTEDEADRIEKLIKEIKE